MRAALLLGLLAACGSSGKAMVDGAAGGDAVGQGDGAMSDTPSAIPRTVFVIPFENEPSSAIYGNTTDAPYINGLTAQAAWTTMFQDELPTLPSEPHYIWMEAGTNQFSDITFTNDNAPSPSHSTASTAHLTAQLEAGDVSWIMYQQGMTAGTCPVSAVDFYAPKHDPVVFFRDIAGSPPSSSNALCAAHHKPADALADDLAHPETMPRYAFITPDLCHDMHGDSGCPQGTNVAANIKAGDDWLAANLPAILTYANAHDGVVFLTFDEGDNSNVIAFYALGPRVVPGAVATTYSHSSLLKSIEEILGVPVLPTVASANDFADMFQPGMFP